MSLTDYKLNDADIASKGVVSAPDRLLGTAQQNKMVFDRLIREAVKGVHNGLIDALASSGGAGEIGTAGLAGVTGNSVQAVLEGLKALIDAKSEEAVTDRHFKSVGFDAGVFTYTREDGSRVELATGLDRYVSDAAESAESAANSATAATQSAMSMAFVTFGLNAETGNLEMYRSECLGPTNFALTSNGNLEVDI